MRFENQAFEGKSVQLDGNEFIGCSFTGCTLVFAGAQLPLLKSCSFRDSSWCYTGQAALTLQFMAAMYGEFRDLIEETFEDIRRGAIPRRA